MRKRWPLIRTIIVDGMMLYAAVLSLYDAANNQVQVLDMLVLCSMALVALMTIMFGDAMERRRRKAFLQNYIREQEQKKQDFRNKTFNMGLGIWEDEDE